MRRMIPTKIIDWIKKVKEYIIQNGTTTEIGGNVEIDGNVQVNGKFVAEGSIEQKSPNYEDGITTVGTFGDLEGVVNYGSIKLINGILHVVFSIKYDNETEDAVNAYSCGVVEVKLPTYIASKIVDVKGEKVSVVATGNNIIAAPQAVASKSGTTSASDITGNPRLVIANHSVADSITIRFSSSTQMTCPANGSIYLEGRCALVIL